MMTAEEYTKRLAAMGHGCITAARVADTFDRMAADNERRANELLGEPRGTGYLLTVAAHEVTQGATLRFAATILRESFGIPSPRPTVNMEAP